MQGCVPEGLVELPSCNRVSLAGVYIRPQLHSKGPCLLVTQGAPKAMGGGSTHQQAQRSQQEVHFPAVMHLPHVFTLEGQNTAPRNCRSVSVHSKLDRCVQ